MKINTEISQMPEAPLIPDGEISQIFIDLGITSFQEACQYIHELPYGYNSTYEDKFILFKEGQGSCTMKHATAAGLAHELGLPVHKTIGVYKFTDEITEGAGEICAKYSLPYIPLTHCFLLYEGQMVDLTVGNRNGKKRPITEFLYTEQVVPFLSKKEEYLLFKKVLRTLVLQRPEMEEIKERTILKARQEAIVLLKEAIK